jgi:hypothetical protein
VVAQVEPAEGDRVRVQAAEHERGDAPGEGRGDGDERDGQRGGGGGVAAGEGPAVVGGHRLQRRRGRCSLTSFLATSAGAKAPPNMQNALTASGRRRMRNKMTGTRIISPTPTVSGLPMSVANLASAVSAPARK